MISFEFHLEKWHEKNQKPLWFLVFPNRYLFRFAMLVAGEWCGCPVDTSVQSTEAPTEAAAETLNQFAQTSFACPLAVPKTTCALEWHYSGVQKSNTFFGERRSSVMNEFSYLIENE